MAGFLSAPGARPAFVLSILMSIFGSVGTLSGIVYLSTPWESTSLAAPGETPSEAAQRELFEPLLRSDLSLAASVANTLASMLLLIASFLVTARRPSSLWWTRQAVWANVLYALGNCGQRLYQGWLIAPQHIALARSQAAAENPEQAAQIAEAAPLLPWMLGAVVVAAALVMIAFYLFMLRLERREDLRAFVTPA